MAKCYLDSNILVYFKNELSKSNSKAKSIISSLLTQNVSLYISSLVIDEFLYAILRELPRTQGDEALETLKKALVEVLDLPRLEIINPPVERQTHLKIIEMMKLYSLHPRDAYHLLICQENHIDSFVTFDNDFRKVFQAKVMIKFPHAR
jgi:predicted nucleic acid-binding protein